jgi:hypothetical protein
LVQSIPDPSALRWCFGSEVYLRTALEDLLDAEAIGAAAPYGPYSLKLFRPSPGNPIWLRPDLTPVNFAQATPAQRDEAAGYIDKIRRLVRPGRGKGRTSMPPDFLDQIREAWATLRSAPDSDPVFITFEDVVQALPRCGPTKRTAERWLKQATGLAWKEFKKTL